MTVYVLYTVSDRTGLNVEINGVYSTKEKAEAMRKETRKRLSKLKIGNYVSERLSKLEIGHYVSVRIDECELDI